MPERKSPLAPSFQFRPLRVDIEAARDAAFASGDPIGTVVRRWVSKGRAAEEAERFVGSALQGRLEPPPDPSCEDDGEIEVFDPLKDETEAGDGKRKEAK